MLDTVRPSESIKFEARSSEFFHLPNVEQYPKCIDHVVLPTKHNIPLLILRVNNQSNYLFHCKYKKLTLGALLTLRELNRRLALRDNVTCILVLDKKDSKLLRDDGDHVTS